MVPFGSSPTLSRDVCPSLQHGPAPRHDVPLRRVAVAVADIAEAAHADVPTASCRALGTVLGLDAARYLSPAGAVGAWEPDGVRHRLDISRHSAQTAVSDVTERPLQWREGECTLLALPVRRGGRRTAVLLGCARRGAGFGRRELEAGMLIAAASGAAEQPFETSEPGLDQWELEHADSESDMARVLLDSLTQVLPVDACRVYGLVRETNRVVPLYCSDRGAVPPGEGETSSPGVGAAGRAILDGRSRLIANARTDRHASRLLPGARGDESTLVLPVIVDGVPAAVAIAARRGVGRFSAIDMRTAERVAARGAAGFRVAIAKRTAEREATISRALLELGDALGGQTSVPAVARMLVAAARQMVPADAVSVWMRRGTGLEFAGGAGYTPAEVRRLEPTRLRVDDPLFAGVLERRDVEVRRLDGSSEYEPLLDGPSRGLSAAVVPVGERVGNRAVIVVQRGPGSPAMSESERRMLQGIADQALIAITNRELYDELEQSFLATVKALATALATKDEYTGEHASELEGLCTRVGEKLGLRGAELRDLGLAAALHDIGKIGIPSPILRKPAALTPDEVRVMRRHPELGARIIAPIAALDGARELVIACHEHWDGTGYPLGLSREQIPLGARIILACDAFHAMTSDRVYRRALDHADALGELERCAGTQFDPVVTRALLDVVG